MSSSRFIYPSSPPNPTAIAHRTTTDASKPRTRQRIARRKKTSSVHVRRPVEMYQAIPYSAGRLAAWPRRSEQAEADGAAGQEGAPARGDGGEAVRRAVAESPVLVVGRRGCCLSHVVKRLLQGLGVNPAVHEVADEAELAAAVAGDEAVVALPAVFVGGRLLGGLDRLMAVHISGELVPILKDAGALWL
ncbi:monothiol glutaredoxin-S9-like [Hordeum vulgare subsp. vulgare]|uniref:Glutaredoxin domain-containing protein n=2 Tax=Hordeum vulgare subsp. vulgare TaxID=112509 RepID=A0A8I7B1M7_HORVV|nr:monothiol glutaredoxin-S9-like [Hordeum vulgare subsp. vulgare]